MNPEELYREVVLNHSKRPRNFGDLPDATTRVQGDNPSCGDEIELMLRIEKAQEGATPTLNDVKFTGQGCAICMASASLMTVKIKGRALPDVERLLETFKQLILAPREEPSTEQAAVSATGDVTPEPHMIPATPLTRAGEGAVATQKNVVTTEDLGSPSTAVASTEQAAASATSEMSTEARVITATPVALGDLRLFDGVRRFPQRVKCVMLPWRALEQALQQNNAAS